MVTAAVMTERFPLPRLTGALLALTLGLAVAVGPTGAAETGLADRVELSGFARLIGGTIDDGGVSFEEYDDSPSFSPQSLVAVQADVEITDSLQLAAQGLLHGSDFRDSGLEWFYLNFEPTASWQFKAGRLRTPFLNYSDVIDVGYAYPWISAPTPLYGSYLFSNYEGVSATFHTAIGENLIDIEAYWGSDDTEVNNAGLEIPVKIDDLRGLVITLERGNFSARAGYHGAGSVEGDVPELVQFSQLLRQLGFTASADSLDLDGSVDAFQAGLRYDNLDYFVIAEALRIESDLVTAPPEIDSVYLTLGKNWYPFQAHLTWGRSESEQPSQGVNEIPVGLSPQLDALAFGYRQIFADVTTDNIDYLSSGVRWDFRSSMALKAEVSWIEERSPSQFFETEAGARQGFDGRVLLFQVGLEWVF